MHLNKAAASELLLVLTAFVKDFNKQADNKRQNTGSGTGDLWGTTTGTTVWTNMKEVHTECIRPIPALLPRKQNKSWESIVLICFIAMLNHLYKCGTFWCTVAPLQEGHGVCMSSLCYRGFSPGPASSHRPKVCTGKLVNSLSLRNECECKCQPCH